MSGTETQHVSETFAGAPGDYVCEAPDWQSPFPVTTPCSAAAAGTMRVWSPSSSPNRRQPIRRIEGSGDSNAIAFYDM